MAVFACAGAAAGLARTPVWTAEAISAVIRPAAPPGDQALFGEDTATVAEGYARLIAAEQVVDDTAVALGVSPDDVRGRLGAERVDGTALYRVVGRGDGEDEAVAIANAASRALRGYVADLNAHSPETAALLRRFRAAAVARDRARRREAEAAAAGDPGARVRARADLAAAGLRAETLRGLYERAQERVAGAAVIRVIAPARYAVDDRRRVLTVLVAAGLAAGLVVGLLLTLVPPRRRGEAYAPRHARR